MGTDCFATRTETRSSTEGIRKTIPVLLSGLSDLPDVDPEAVADAALDGDGSKIMIVQSDLRQFYDRVRPDFLAAKIDAAPISQDDDPRFYGLTRRVLNWEWNASDVREVDLYARQSALSEFSAIALPQGLVSAGFFANIALLDFDDALRGSFDQDLVPGVRLIDACRYVDDLRLVMSTNRDSDGAPIATTRIAVDWLQTRLNLSAAGLLVSEEKTRTAEVQGDEQPLVRQSPQNGPHPARCFRRLRCEWGRRNPRRHPRPRSISATLFR